MKQEIPKLSVSLYNILEVCSECFLEIETRDKTNGLSLCLQYHKNKGVLFSIFPNLELKLPQKIVFAICFRTQFKNYFREPTPRYQIHTSLLPFALAMIFVLVLIMNRVKSDLNQFLMILLYFGERVILQVQQKIYTQRSQYLL